MLNVILQGVAFEKFHGDKVLALILAEFVDRADIGMIERRGGLGFAEEALEGLGFVRPFRRKEFQGDYPIQLHVLGGVNDAHPAATNLLMDPVVRNDSVDQGWWPSLAADVRLRRDSSQSEDTYQHVPKLPCVLPPR